MSFIQMSVSGALMILVTIVLRVLFLHKLPKRTFMILWSVVLVRLLIPYSLPSIFSAYSLLQKTAAVDQVLTNIITHADVPTTEALSTTVDLFTVIWLTGFLILSVFFAVSYIRCIKKFGKSLPVNDEYITEWLSEHHTQRKISVRQSDMISTPLTYGIFRPVILLPKKPLQDKTLDRQALKYVLSHEYLHIQRFDAVFKLVLTAALCVHWFDPMVWVMYVIANRDIEISCDEGVVRMLGEAEKTDYAMALITMEEKKCVATQLITYFNKKANTTATKERIVNIMKFKKVTALAVITAALLILGTTAAFATSAKNDKNEEPDQQISDIAEPQGDSASDIVMVNGLPYYYYDF